MPRSVWLLIIGMLINTVGSSFLWPLNTIYMHDHLGQSLSVAGLVLMGNAAAGVIGNLIGGYVFDKFGGFKSILLGTIISILGLICLVIWHGWPHYVWFLTLIGFSGGIVFPSMFAMVGTAWPEGGRKGFNAIYLAQNLGVAIGPALAGVVANKSFDYLFVANLIMYILFFFVALSYKGISTDNGMAPPSVISESSNIKNRSTLNALIILGIGYLLSWMVYTQWTTTISSYTQDLGISLNQYSLLWTTNGLLIVLGQPLINPIVKKMGEFYKGQIFIGIVIFIISFAVVSYAATFKMFLVAIMILTFGEMFVWPIVPTIASSLAPKGKEGFYQGLINSFSAIGKMIGPFLGGVLADQYGMKITFFVLIGILAIALIPYMLYDRPLKQNERDNA
ncbi:MULTISPECIES: MFS transporter [unclassified Rummeliibacillus]|uniref:MDR family MFS transporter n=1 Tax=unclassified Rummeliibacillus TaxID=2622809 RepID=UPI000E66F91A|nr:MULTISPECIES: MFS transporter [unclassified Rummeliibacillus]RIJ63413.1 MFS transporter [Rummeliibacillus sp. POC4]RPJ94165.1 MFS transporter [Rummeliibacillus sp. TYF005]